MGVRIWTSAHWHDWIAYPDEFWTQLARSCRRNSTIRQEHSSYWWSWRMVWKAATVGQRSKKVSEKVETTVVEKVQEKTEA